MSFKVVGVLFKVYNELGPGYQEKYYQRAISIALKNENISFKEQVYTPLVFESETIGRYFLDFVIEGKIILEIKSAPQLYSRDIKQILAYLKTNDFPLGIIANFHKTGLKYRRLLKGL